MKKIVKSVLFSLWTPTLKVRKSELQVIKFCYQYRVYTLWSLYVDETKGQLSMCTRGHRFGINSHCERNQVLYQHFNWADHPVMSMKERILEKVHHHYKSVILSTPVRGKHEKERIF